MKQRISHEALLHYAAEYEAAASAHGQSGNQGVVAQDAKQIALALAELVAWRNVGCDGEYTRLPIDALRALVQDCEEPFACGWCGKTATFFSEMSLSPACGVHRGPWHHPYPNESGVERHAVAITKALQKQGGAP